MEKKYLNIDTIKIATDGDYLYYNLAGDEVKFKVTETFLKELTTKIEALQNLYDKKYARLGEKDYNPADGREERNFSRNKIRFFVMEYLKTNHEVEYKELLIRHTKKTLKKEAELLKRKEADVEAIKEGYTHRITYNDWQGSGSRKKHVGYVTSYGHEKGAFIIIKDGVKKRKDTLKDCSLLGELLYYK